MTFNPFQHTRNLQQTTLNVFCHYEHFLILQQCFQKLSDSVCMREMVNVSSADD